ncbi:MAG: S24/S26 family peptidase [Bacteroidaceae bacterium]|nr:S24/S26 family peptidase [Bacteroidaceae bacterium]
MNMVELPNEIFHQEVSELIADGQDVTLRVRGVSMRPFLEDRRDKIVLTRLGEVKVGDAVLAEIAPGKYVYHRVYCIEADKVTLRGDGNIYGTEQCGLDDIVASTKWLIRKDKYYSPDGKVWKWYSALWPKNILARRVLLKLYRLLKLYK